MCYEVDFFLYKLDHLEIYPVSRAGEAQAIECWFFCWFLCFITLTLGQAAQFAEFLSLFNMILEIPQNIQVCVLVCFY